MRGTSFLWTFVAVCAWLAACEPASEPDASSRGDVPRAQAPLEAVRDASDARDEGGRERPRIVAFGNSLTAGLGVPSTEAYPAQLQRRLDQSGYRYLVINAGVSGDTTAGALRRVEWVLRSRPRLVIVELGANDGLRGIDVKETRTNLERIIERLQAAGVTVVLAGMKLPPNYGADYTGRFAAIYPELARKYHLVLMPFFLEGVGAQTSLNQADGVHPTAGGYRVIVDHLMPILEPLLEKTEAGGSRS